MKNINRRLNKLEEQRPERPPFPEWDPERPTESLMAMIEYTHRYPGPRAEPWDDEKMGCTAESYFEVIMQGGRDED